MNTPPDPTVVVKMIDGLRSSRLTDLSSFPKRLRFDDSFQLSSDSSSFFETASAKPTQHVKDSEIEIIKSELTSVREQLNKCKLDAETERNDHEWRASQNEEVIIKQKQKIEDLTERNEILSQKAEDFARRFETLKCETDVQVLELKSNIVRLNKDIDEQADGVKELLRNFTENLNEKEKECSDRDMQLVEKEKIIESLQSKLDSTLPKSLELENLKLKYAVLQQTVHELELKLSQEKEKDIYPRLSNEEFNSYQTMKSQIQHLKNDNELYKEAWDKHLVLEEELCVMRRELELKEKNSKQAQELKVKYHDIQKQLGQWETLLTDLFDEEQRKTKQPGYYTVKDHIMNMQKHHIQLTEALKEAQSEKDTYRQNITDITSQLSATKRELERTKEVLKCQEYAVKKFKNKSMLMTKEVDMLKTLLSSYESEVTVNYGALEKQRIHQLENILQDYKQQVKNLEQERGVDVPRLGSSEDVSKLEERIRVLEVQNQKLEERKTALETQLEYKALKGDYDPMKVRVVHHQTNPLVKGKEERGQIIENLQKEVTALKIKIKKLESGEGSSNSSMLSQSVVATAADVEDLKRRLSSSEKKQTRIVEMYNQASKELRENIYCLTGYRMDVMYGGTMYKLKHKYAEAEGDELVFENKNGQLSLLETPFSRQRWVREVISTTLEKDHSIPCFLAAVTNTLHQFSKQAVIEDDSEIVISD